MATAMQVRHVMDCFSSMKNSHLFSQLQKPWLKMNKVMNPAQMSKVTQQFTQEHTKLGIKEEMSMYSIKFPC